MSARILIVDDDPFNRKLVSATMENAGYDVATSESGPDTLARIEEIKPDLIILDVMMPDMDGYEVCRRLRSESHTAHTPIIMLTAGDTLKEKIEGFEAGADDYMTKPFQPAELQARVGGLLRRSVSVKDEVDKTTSKIMAVFSLRGGVGVSTLSTNLAVGLAQLWGRPVALLDLALTAGQSALMLNLPLRNTWADLTSMPVDEIETDLLNDMLLPHSSGVNVLAAPRNPGEGELITADTIKRVVQLLNERYHYLILDLPHDFRDTTLVGLDAAQEIILLLAPELASVRATASALNVFASLDYSLDHTYLILNWIFQRRGLARKDIESVLKRSIDLIIPFAPDVFVPAINLGNPPISDAPDTPIGALLEDFAFLVSKDEHRNKRPKNPTDAWGRVVQRAQQRRKK
ncbi:MAG: response regulator [Chloroflexi bacterium]|nr:response regulator [Chloroflexota bacterium]MBU1662338.1 response regulator [Chloroflexota bacterium]